MDKKWLVILPVVALIGICFLLCPCRKNSPCMFSGRINDRQCFKPAEGNPMGQHGYGMDNRREKEVLLAADGGLFVVTGNHIIKYDQDLNLVRSVEIDADIKPLRHDQSDIKKGYCPMKKGSAPLKENGPKEGLLIK